MHTTRSARVFLAVTLTVTSFLVAAPARATGDLEAFLQRTEKMADFPHAVRADIRISHGDTVESAVVVIDPASKREFLAVKSSGWRALMPLDWKDGKAAASIGGKVSAFRADDPLPHTDLRAIDFFPFWNITNYGKAFISDDERMEKTITLYAPAGNPYTLFVITFDKEKLVPLTIKLYRDSVSNLVRLRRDSDIAMVGARPRPKHIEIQDYAENSLTTIDLTWRALDSVPPAMIDDAGFSNAEVDWPTEPVAER